MLFDVEPDLIFQIKTKPEVYVCRHSKWLIDKLVFFKKIKEKVKNKEILFKSMISFSIK